jgi:hypothetical protein
MDKNLTCSIVALEIIDFSKKAIAEQSEIKKQLNDLINHALIDVPQIDRFITETDQGALIAFTGQLEDALDDALLVSLTVRDEILKNNTQSLKPIYVQFGINLGTVSVVNKKQQQVITGDGVNEAYRIMSFANPNQILVSRAYHETASNLTQEISKMFEPYDMHAHEEEIYAVRRAIDQAMISPGFDELEDPAPQSWQSMAIKLGWKSWLIGLLALFAILFLGKRIIMPIEPTIIMDPPVVAEVNKKHEDQSDKQPVQILVPDKLENTQSASTQEVPNKVEQEPVKANVVKKKSAQKTAVEVEVAVKNPDKSEKNVAVTPVVMPTEKHHHVTAEVKKVENKPEKKMESEKSSWQAFKESVKSGTEHVCSQAESSMGQCKK